MLAIGPAVMGFTTYSSQNNIYFDLETITVYLLGDLLMVYVIALLVGAAIDNQIVFIFNYIQTKVFGKENKYSILLLEEWMNGWFENRFIYIAYFVVNEFFIDWLHE